MIYQKAFRLLVIVALVIISSAPLRAADETLKAFKQPTFSVGFAKQDITPKAPMPMWGYGARHDMLSDGTLSPLFAKAIVIQVDKDKVALVGLDLGRGPTRPMMKKIRREIAKQANIQHVMISGSHTHHGPVIELLDLDGFGKGRFDAAIAYNQKLPDLLIEAILAADRNAQPARIGVASKQVSLNRNRHSKRIPKAVDPELSILRFDPLETKKSDSPIAILVNYAAHPVMTEGAVLKFSPDYPGFLEDKVEQELQTGCVFMQGASGDMSVNSPEGVHGPQAYGELLAKHVIKMAEATQTESPKIPAVQGRVDHFLFKSRVDFNNPLITYAYGKAFFPELIRCVAEELKDGIPPQLNTVLLNKEIALVGGSGEFFCNHSNRLKERSYVKHTFFFGYCNDHYLYFPTIEAVSEGGYGADPSVSPVEIGAGEKMMNQALVNIYTMLGKFPEEETTGEAEKQ